MSKREEDRLPTYEEVLEEDSNIPPPMPERPQQQAQQQQQRPSRPPGRPPNHSGNATLPPRPNPNNFSHTYHNHNRLPWIYPQGYYCQKCGNTGYKIKDGSQCKRCWRQFAHNSRPVVNTVNYTPIYPPQPPPPPPGPPLFGPNAPLIVSPGDPRLGGYPCAECRGTGRIRFFLDQETCPVCRGIGRIYP